MNAHAARKHSKLSPSSSHRWIPCAGSIRMSEGIETKSGVWADEGTAAHQVGEMCLRESLDPVDFLGGHANIKTGKVLRNPGEGPGIFEITDEMVDAVGLYVETIRVLIEPGDEVEYEAKLDLTHIPGMGSGTGDCVIYKPATRRLIIADLKYGKGVAVRVNKNPQTRTYALGASQRFHNRGVDVVENIIVQPRCPMAGDDPPGVRREVIDAVELLEFRFEIERAAAATAAPDAPLNPGEWCKFCPAAGTCPALRQKVEAVAEMEFGPSCAVCGEPQFDTPSGMVCSNSHGGAPSIEPQSALPSPVNEMTSERMASVLRKASMIHDWVKAVEERAHQMARDGSPPAGFKLVATRAFRRWKDEDALVRFARTVLDLREHEIYVEPKVKSPAALEKVLGSKRKGEVADLITAKSNGTILVPQDDPRPPVKADAETEFA